MSDRVMTGILIEDDALDCEEFAHACGVSVDWISLHVAVGALPVSGENPAAWRFSGLALRRARRLFELEQTYEALPELAALVLDLQDEIARLRRRGA
ncbi:hypothetical protein BURK2_02094 [Burkholderiales bacterium]|nr:MAG: MerR family transcriptional regulator [Burkholderiales bacterium]CAG0985653.1 hypothetical protein BURK2_02094 [Burkholderiales bacterium]